jgi:tRNA(Ile)-lysidine synthase
MLPIDPFQEFIVQNALFNHSNKVLLAVSGGKDSALMAHLFNESGFKFGIAHCNFNLRGEESDLDEQFTRDLAAGFGAPFYTASFDTEETARKEHISIEMAARNLRYSWLEAIRKEKDYDFIALAHHKNDSAETILLNLVRGTGISGLHGILPKRDLLVRPLLFLSRKEINAIIDHENIAFREDSSNASVVYARNKIRLEVIPKLKELNPALEKTFEQNSRRFLELEEYFKEQMALLRNKLLKEQPSGDHHIALADLKTLKPQRTLLFELFCPFGFRDNVLEDLTATWNGISGKIFESATHTILLDRDKLILRKKEQNQIGDTLVPENEVSVQWGSHLFTWQAIEAKGLKLLSDPGRAYFDFSMLVFPLKFRSWKQGDTFIPLGMTGKKKLSDFFINKKIPLNGKHLTPVLENGNGDIIWIAGYQADNRYKVTSHTEKVIIFEMQK